MNTVAVAVPDPTTLPVVTVDWQTGATSVELPLPVVNIPIGVGIPGRDGSSSATVLTQASPSAQWSFPNPLGRVAAVAVFDTAGNEVDADVTITAAFVVVTFAQPFTGKAVIC